MTETPGKYLAPPGLEFNLSGAVVPKARARVTKNGTYLPRRYRDWKDSAIAELFLQARSQGVTSPLDCARIQISLLGKYPRRGDLDNVAGSILDALTQSGIIRDDALNVVNRLSIDLLPSKEPPAVAVKINQGEELPPIGENVADSQNLREFVFLSLATIQSLKEERDRYRKRLRVYDDAMQNIARKEKSKCN